MTWRKLTKKEEEKHDKECTDDFSIIEYEEEEEEKGK